MISIQYDPFGVASYGVLRIAINMQSLWDCGARLRGLVALHATSLHNGPIGMGLPSVTKFLREPHVGAKRAKHRAKRSP
jgi:hypothetical protein